MQRLELLEYIFKINSFAKQIFKNKDNIDFDPGINKTQEKVLMTVAFDGPIPMTKVSEKFALEKGSFTQIADSLEQLQYIKRVRSEADRRIILLEITEEGKLLAEKIHDCTKLSVANQLGKLSIAQQEEFLRALKTAADLIEMMRRKDDNL